MSFFLFFAVFFLCFAKPVYASDNYVPISIRIPFYCEQIAQKEEAFYEIRIRGISENAPRPEEEKEIIQWGQGNFLIFVTEPGTYRYRITQYKGTAKDVVYDESSFDVYVCVVDNGEGKLHHTLSVTKADSDIKPDTLLFANYCENSTPPPSDERTSENEDQNTAVDARSRILNSMFSSKTGENNAFYVSAFFAGMILLAIGAGIYVSGKKRRLQTGLTDHDEERV
ncbi:MAG: hypothetical protein K5879_06830 [Lachnospiraceae bacterium]|nr:hypothetical protein [Lachnospiraceae bacterium]